MPGRKLAWNSPGRSKSNEKDIFLLVFGSINIFAVITVSDSYMTIDIWGYT